MLTKLPEPVLASAIDQPDTAAEGATSSSLGADSSPAPDDAPLSRQAQARARRIAALRAINDRDKARIDAIRKDRAAAKKKLSNDALAARLRQNANLMKAGTAPILDPLTVNPTPPPDSEQARLVGLISEDGRLPLLLDTMAKNGGRIKDAAAALGLTYDTARSLLKRARARARKRSVEWVLDTVLVPKSLTVLNGALDKGDKTVALEVAKGRGHLRTHTAVKQEGAQTQVALAVKIEMPKGNGPVATIPAGAIVGAPNVPALPEAPDAVQE